MDFGEPSVVAERFIGSEAAERVTDVWAAQMVFDPSADPSADPTGVIGGSRISLFTVTALTLRGGDLIVFVGDSPAGWVPHEPTGGERAASLRHRALEEGQFATAWLDPLATCPHPLGGACDTPDVAVHGLGAAVSGRPDPIDELLGFDPNDPLDQRAAALVAADTSFLASLRAQRVASGLSVAEIARRMDTSLATVEEIESGDRDPRLSLLRRYAMAIGVRYSHRVEFETAHGDR